MTPERTKRLAKDPVKLKITRLGGNICTYKREIKQGKNVEINLILIDRLKEKIEKLKGQHLNCVLKN